MFLSARRGVLKVINVQVLVYQGNGDGQRMCFCYFYLQLQRLKDWITKVLKCEEWRANTSQKLKMCWDDFDDIS